MARYYRRRYRTIVRAPKKKWASNIKGVSILTQGTATSQYYNQVLAENSSEASSPTPVIVKVGNIKIQGDYRVSSTDGTGNASVSLYVVFVPQGYSIESDVGANALITNHPEWIMAWRFLGANGLSTSAETFENFDKFSFSSRLKRNLNSGDTIQLICLATGTKIADVRVYGMAQFWTCAN